MAAIIHTSPRTTGFPVRSAGPPRPELRLIEGGRRDAARPSPSVLARRRLVVGAVVVILVAVATIAIGRGALASVVPDAPAVGSAAPVVSDHATSVIVRPGDTFWSIARRAQPSGDVRPLVDRLVAQHGGDPLRPGQRVALG